MPNTQHPPKLAQRFLLRFLREELVDEVQGDLEEKFYVSIKNKSLFSANLNYWYQTFNYIRPFALRKSKSPYLNQLAMFQNYFKIGWRNLYRQKMYSSINIGGFALGIAACFLISLFILDELSYDVHYNTGDQVYRIVGVLEGEKTDKDVFFPAPAAKAVANDYADILKSGRYNPGVLFGGGSNEIRRTDRLENTYEEGFTYFDQSLLEILEIPMVYGSRERALDQPNTMVITRRKADKYFPNENPIGKTMIVNDEEKQTYKIGGVIEDFLPTSHIQYDFLITLTGKEFWPGEQSTWQANNYPTYVRLNSGTDAGELAKKMTRGMLEKYYLPAMVESGEAKAKELLARAHIELQPLRNIYLDSDVQDGLPHGDRRFIWLFGVIALFILVLACINFINLATARSANRAKEVGLRKVVGSFRSSIIYQFLSESLLFSMLSFAAGILLALILLPYFNLLSGKSLIFPWTEVWLFPLLAGSSVVVGILAGLYPSFYLSSFKPIHVLKGNLSMGSKSSRTRSLLVIFQFTTSIILIVGTFIVYRQMEFILNKKVGFDKDQVVLIQGARTLGKQTQTFKNELLRLPQVKFASVSDYLPVQGTKRNGNPFFKEGKQKIDEPVYGQMWVVDADYIKTMGMKLVEGRDFDEQIRSDSMAVIINQAMARKLNLVEPLGTRISNWETFSVIAVVEDFHFESMKESIGPIALRLGNRPSIISVKAGGSDMVGLLASIEKVWKQFAPHQPIRYAFLDDRFASMYADVQRMGRIFTSFAILAIIVACLGLFALSSFMVEQRSKEISIRLVLGASLNSIFQLLTKNFIKLVIISFVIAAPIAWYMMQKWLQDYVYKTEIGWDVFALAGVMALTIAILTISYQAVRAALVNPVNSLRSE